MLLCRNSPVYRPVAAIASTCLPAGGTAVTPLSVGQPTQAGQLYFPGKYKHRMQECNPACEAYVGQTTELASEYHESDFSWDAHAAVVAPLVAAQEAQAMLLQGSAAAESHSVTSPAADRVAAAVPEVIYEGHKWEEFYQQHPSAKFFKERRYLLLEFPVLAEENPPKHIAEIGCGCGSAILPVLKANSQATCTVTDISATSIQQLIQAAHSAGIEPTRICSAFVADSTFEDTSGLFSSIYADCLLIMFTLSAVRPDQQLTMLQNAFKALKPGGKLLIRDHGLYDMVQLRIPPEQWVASNLYKRGDGTLAYFFSVQDISSKAAAVGFTVDECKYVCVINRNKKTGQELRRVFVHCVFTRPV